MFPRPYGRGLMWRRRGHEMLVEVVVSRVVVLLTSVTVITHSARRVVQQERDGLKLQDECENSASHTHTHVYTNIDTLPI